ncbi:hypothetical protein GUITHDRAFT_151611 [Guillardia theta CCMP2712]|uniref:Uncharacterized protein n=1 Tax=Guillardia theta (strain CCMP2712) TaxID=905079 RepID=L1JLR7_GUITC|nr:hypothetical protein GUITHDRAFT_151611 [Guillardia theta CCMP2712]EKX49085.1 hypothetical protein GUITHDRAFT_151611 [Guillardia theta CCMP2712]|eukprot:XP_005836065.1 hypothetical protein GUITHDRAFT_151611 [Guillardia theta CCMP2712]
MPSCSRSQGLALCQVGRLVSCDGSSDTTAADKLKEANIDTAEKLMGNFMVMGRSEEKMAKWLEDVCEVRSVEAKKISAALVEKGDKICSM